MVRARLLFLVLLIAVASACGASTTPTSPAASAAAPPVAVSTAAVAPGPLTADEVMQAFTAATGVHLQVMSSNGAYELLMPTIADAGDATATFGPFALYLVRPGHQLDAAAIFGGEHGHTRADGITWFPPGPEDYWYAAKHYRNLWVQWKGGIHEGVNPTWTALDAALTPLR